MEAVLLYGSETWRITKSTTKKIQTFINGGLRKNPTDSLAGDNQQPGSLAKDWPAVSRQGNKETEMEMDRTYPQKATNQHHMTSPDLESPRKEEEGETAKQLEKGPGGRHPGDRIHLEQNREAGPGSGTLACGCWWPIPTAGREA